MSTAWPGLAWPCLLLHGPKQVGLPTIRCRNWKAGSEESEDEEDDEHEGDEGAPGGSRGLQLGELPDDDHRR